MKYVLLRLSISPYLNLSLAEREENREEDPLRYER